MEIRRCMKCMHDLKPEENVCPECGRAYGSTQAEAFALKPGTILDGKYLVGEMLGQGGFGITYIGFDLLLEQKVAIKEYFPMSTGMVSRENRSTVVWSKTMMEKSGFQRGFDSFLKEARKMARLGEIPNVVSVKSVFIQNETAYIVMDFIEGETLQKKLRREGPMTFDTCVPLLMPIMRAMAEVHRHGIIHRDISPDNIMVRKDGRLILLDLGAAKDLDIQAADGTVQSSQVVAKQGFSPFEQYGRNGKIGPWTDVYAMAATVYYCCTGKLPPSAIDRVDRDSLSCQPPLTKVQFDALSACMTVMPDKRPQNMDVMVQILSQALNRKSTPPKRTLPRWLLPAAAVGLAAVLAIAIGIGVWKQPTAGNGTNIAAQTIPANVHVMAAAEDLSGVDSDDRADRYIWGQETYKRRDVETVTFQRTLSGAPDSAWDVSEAGDKSILAWMDGADLYVAADGKIAPNSNASYLFTSFENLKKINFGDCLYTANVTDMRLMFCGCGSLTELDVSGFDTTKVTNLMSMFWGCSSLTSLDVSRFKTANVTNMYGVFGNCAGLKKLDVSHFDTSNVTSMGAMFQMCGSLKELDVSGFNTAKVTDMSYMFSRCSGLTALDVSGFNTANVTDMSFMFSKCSGLTALDVSRFDTSNSTSMEAMFQECGSLTSLDVSGFNTANVTSMSFLFNKCSGLTALNVSGFNTANVTTMDAMFQECSGLTRLDVSGFDTANVTVMDYMFNQCGGLKELDLSGFNTANVTNMSRMFQSCGSLARLDVSGFNTANVTDMENLFSGCGKLTDLRCSDKKILAKFEDVIPAEVHVMMAAEDLSDIDVDVRVDRYFWGQNRYKRGDVKTVTFQSSLSGAPGSALDVSEAGDGSILAWMDGGNLHVAADGKIAPNPNASWMFAHFENLEEIDFGNCFDTSNVTDMSFMFDICRSLKALDLSGFDTANVTRMDAMFQECSSLTRLDVSGFDTANVKVMDYMFNQCSSLKELDLSGFDTSNVINMCTMFQLCGSLTRLDVSGFDTANVTDMSYMFNKCRSLTALDLASFDTAMVTDMSRMFQACSSLTRLDVSGFNAANVTDMDNLFSGCDSLTDLRCSDNRILAKFEGGIPAEVHVMAAEDLSEIDVDAGADEFFWGQKTYRRGDVKTVTFQSTLSGAPGNAWDVSEAGDRSILAWMDGGNLYVAANGRIALNPSAMYLFAQFENMTGIDFGNCVDTSNVTDMFAMFSGCSSLKALDLSQFDTANVTDMCLMFGGCWDLTELDLSGFNTEKVTDMSYMFYACSSLTDLDISGFDSINVTEMTEMFSECTSLTNLRCSDKAILANR